MDSFNIKLNQSTLVNALNKNIKSSKKGIRFIEKNNEEMFIAYSDLYKEALYALNNMQSLGIQKGNELILQIDNNRRFLTIFWACMLGGIIPVPLTLASNDEGRLKVINAWKTLNHPRIVTNQKSLLSIKEYVSEKHDYLSEDINIYSILEDDLCSHMIKKGRVCEVDEEDIAFIQFTSGSTGEAKGVVLTHFNLMNNINAIIECAKLTCNDSTLSWMPLTHDMGIIGFHLVPLVVDINQYIIPTKSFIRNPMIWLGKVNEHKATVTSSPNFGYRYFLSSFKTKTSINWDLSHVRLIFNGAEPISVTLCNEFLTTMKEYGLKNQSMFTVYGMAEASLAISFPIPQKDFGVISLDRNSLEIGSKTIDVEYNHNTGVQFVCLGYPITNCEVRICDENNNILDENIIGHIQIKGNNVTSKYYNNKSATEKVYTYDGWLKTGDLGLIRNGQVVVTGRHKDIIFINGQNYYSHDLERIAEEMQGISQGEVAACSVYNRETYGEDIGLFVVYRKKIEDFIHLYKELKTLISNRLGIDVNNIVPVRRMPKTTSGKIQRYKFAEGYKVGEFEETVRKIRDITRNECSSTIEVLPTNETEQKLYDLYKEIVKHNSFDINNNLIELGANSIAIMKMISKVNDEFNCDISISEFMKNCSISQLAKLIQKSDKVDNNINKKYEPDIQNMLNPFPLTDIQIAYLMGRDEKYELGGISTHFYVEIETQMEMDKFNKSLNTVIQRHPMLRTVFLVNGTQKILNKVSEYIIDITDYSNVDSKELNKAILHKRNGMSHHIFETNKFPLFEISAFKVSEKKHYLFLSFDMLIMDGMSIQIFAKDLIEFYDKDNVEKETIDFTFRDYVLAFNHLKQTSLYMKSKKYWMEKLDEFPSAPSLPMIRKPEDIIKPRFNRIAKVLNKELWSAIKQKAQISGITSSTMLFMAYSTVLAYWSNQDSFAINMTTFNRMPFHKDVNKIIGDFTSVVLIKVDYDHKKSFIDGAKTLQNIVFEALENRYFSGVELIREIGRRNSLESKAIMPIVFTSMIFGDEGYSWSELGDIKMGISQTSQVYLDNQVVDMDGELSITWDYVEDIFDNEVIEYMFNHYIEILEAMVKTDIVTPLKVCDSHNKIIEQYNNTDEDNISPALLHELFISQAEKTPNNKAIVFESDEISYKELNIKSSQVAFYLNQNGIGKKSFVGIYAKRSINTIINILGIIKSGAAYVPIDIDSPKDRQKYIIENSGCNLVLEADFVVGEEYLNIDEYSTNVDIDADDIAYVIYTSGSTGKPKGVVIKHSAVTNTIIDINQKFEVNENDRIGGISSICFDLSVYDIFGALSTGATLVLINDPRNIDELYKTLIDKKVTVWNTVPSIMNILVDSAGDGLISSYLRLVLLSGDWIPINLPSKIKSMLSNAKIYSLGGATEASIWSIYYPIEAINEEWTSIPYGIPLANQKMYILNSDLNHCPLEVSGEIFIGGVGVAQGYINDQEKTDRAFIEHREYGRLYRTGDFGVLHKEGYMEFLGRKDNQLKIRGYRVELGEIESTLLEYDDLNSVVVVDRKNEQGNIYLCAYITSNKQVKAEDVRRFLNVKLPQYMIPSHVIQLEELPLSLNGKVDRKGLPEPIITHDEKDRDALLTPRNEKEKILVSVWRDILGVDEIGIEDNFFELGGDSIKAIQITAALQKHQLLMEVRDLLRFQNIKTLSEYVRKTEIQISQENILGDVKISPAQEWFFSRIFTEIDHWNLAVTLIAKDKFDDKIILEVFNKIVENNDALRIKFDIDEGNISQYNMPFEEKMVELKIFDFRQFDDYQQKMTQEVKKLHKGIKINKEPLLKLGLFKTTNGDYLTIIVHHLVVDGISLRIILEDFHLGYRQAMNNKKISLQSKTHSFKHWVSKVHEYAHSKELLLEGDYWQEIERVGKTVLRGRKKNSKDLVKDGVSTSIKLTKEETQILLKEVNKAYNTEITEILLTALGLTIKDWLNNDTVLISLEGHGREDILKNINISRTVGWFTAIYPVILNMSKSEDLSYLIQTVKEDLRHIPNNGTGYGILKYITKKKEDSIKKLELEPEIGFNYLGQFDEGYGNEIFSLSDIDLENFFSENSERLYKLDIVGMVINSELHIVYNYNKNEFEHKEIEYLIKGYHKNLLRIIEHCRSIENSILTPSDIGDNQLTIEELDFISDVVNDLEL